MKKLLFQFKLDNNSNYILWLDILNEYANKWFLILFLFVNDVHKTFKYSITILCGKNILSEKCYTYISLR